MLGEHKFHLTAAGAANPEIENVQFWPVRVAPNSLVRKVVNTLLLKTRLFSSYYSLIPAVRELRRVWVLHQKPKFDLIIANDIDSLPVALELAGDSPVFFDAHEYSPGEWGGWQFNFVFSQYRHWQCQEYLPKAAAMSTVCPGIAEAYAKEFGIKEPMIILNAPNYSEIQPSRVDDAQVKLVHHGVALRQRNLEVMIETLDRLGSRFTLDFYLVAEAPSSIAYLKDLKQLAKGMGLLDKQIYFREPVKTDLIPMTLNSYDLGIFLLKPNNKNYELALPNKFFEFVQARLAIAIGPSMEMVRVLQEYDLGVVAKDFSAEAMSRAISRLTVEDIRRFKQNAGVAAGKLSFDAQIPLFMRTVQRLLNRD